MFSAPVTPIHGGIDLGAPKSGGIYVLKLASIMLSEDHVFLRRAIQLAWSARQNGNYPFGAVLVGVGGEVLAEADNTVLTDHDCTAHAELNLVRLVSGEYDLGTLAECTLYSSTEPCAMCAGAIHWSGIGRVVYALSEERLYQLTSNGPADRPLLLPCREVLARTSQPIEVDGPLLEGEAERVHLGFWHL